MPFVIHTLGPEGYGTWTLITSMTGYIGLLALGVPMASVRYVAQYVAEGDRQKTNQAIGSCAGLYLMIGVAAASIGTASMALFSVYEIPSSLQETAHLAFGLMVLQVSAGFLGLLPEGIMFAHHDFVVRNLVRISGVLLRLSLTMSLLTLEASLVILALIQIACLGFDFGVSWLLVRRRYPGVRLSLADFDGGMLRRIFAFSLYVLLLNTGARLSFETDALVIGAFMGVGPIAFYAVANSLVVYLMDFIASIAAVVSPMATRLNTEGKMADLRVIFLKWSKAALSLTIMAGLLLIVLGPRFIGGGVGPSFEHPAREGLQILIGSSLLFLPVTGVGVPVPGGLRRPRVAAAALLAARLLDLGLS